MGSINDLVKGADISYDSLMKHAQGKYNMGEVVFKDGKFGRVNNHAGFFSYLNNVVTTDAQNKATNAAVFKALLTHAAATSPTDQDYANQLLNADLGDADTISDLLDGHLYKIPYVKEAFEFLMTGDNAAPLSRDELKMLGHLLDQKDADEQTVKDGFKMLKDLRAMKAGAKEIVRENAADENKAEYWISGLKVKKLSDDEFSRVTTETVNKRAARTLEAYAALEQGQKSKDTYAKLILFKCMPDLINAANENIRKTSALPEGDLNKKGVDKFLTGLTAGLEDKFELAWEALEKANGDRWGELGLPQEVTPDVLKKAVYDQLIDYMGESLYRDNPDQVEGFFFNEMKDLMLGDIIGPGWQNAEVSAKGSLLKRLATHNYAIDRRFVETTGGGAGENVQPVNAQMPEVIVPAQAGPMQLTAKELARCLGITQKQAANLRLDPNVAQTPNGLYRLQTYVDKDDKDKTYTVMIDGKGVAFSKADYLYCADALLRVKSEEDAFTVANGNPIDFFDHREMKSVVRLARLLSGALKTKIDGVSPYEIGTMLNIFTNLLVTNLPEIRRISGDGPISLAAVYEALKLKGDVPFENSPHAGIIFAQALAQKFRADFNAAHPWLPEEKTGLSPYYFEFLSNAVGSEGVRYEAIINACKDRSTYSKENVCYMTPPPIHRERGDLSDPDRLARFVYDPNNDRSKKESGNIAWNYKGMTYRFNARNGRDSLITVLTEDQFTPQQILSLSESPSQSLWTIGTQFGLEVDWRNADVDIRKDGDVMKAVLRCKCTPMAGDTRALPADHNVLRYEVSITKEGDIYCDSFALVRDELKVLPDTIASRMIGDKDLSDDVKTEIGKWSDDLVCALQDINGHMLTNPFFVNELDDTVREKILKMADYLQKNVPGQSRAEVLKGLWGQVVYAMNALNEGKDTWDAYCTVLSELKEVLAQPHEMGSNKEWNVSDVVEDLIREIEEENEELPLDKKRPVPELKDVSKGREVEVDLESEDEDD